MLDDLYLFFILSKYKLGLISRLELFDGIKEYVKSKGPIFIKFIQILLINHYKHKNELSDEEIANIKLLLDNVYENYEDADFQVGCGSVAYVSYDKDDKNLVIKRLLPDIIEKINYSASELKKLVYLASFKYELNFSDEDLESYKDLLLKQTDLIQEKKNLDRMYLMFKDFNEIIIPKVIDYNSDMIKMEYVNGLKLSDFVKKYPDKKENCKSLLNFCFKVMINNKFFHGDLHEGNFLFSLDSKNNVMISIIDFGLVFEITDEQQDIFLDFLLSGRNEMLFFYQLTKKDISYQEFCNKLGKYERKKKCTGTEIIETMKENNIKINTYLSTFILSLYSLKLLIDNLHEV